MQLLQTNNKKNYRDKIKEPRARINLNYFNCSLRNLFPERLNFWNVTSIERLHSRLKLFPQFLIFVHFCDHLSNFYNFKSIYCVTQIVNRIVQIVKNLLALFFLMFLLQ